MDYICDFILIVLAASFTGSIFVLIRNFIIKHFDKFLKTNYIYGSLKFVIISFCIPSIVLILMFKTYFIWGGKHYYLLYTNFMRVILSIIFVIFVAILAREIILWIKGNNMVTKSIFMQAKAGEDVLKIVEELKIKLNIKRKFKVYRAFGITSSFIYGFFFPKIYITLDVVDEEDLRMVLTHELCHYKQRDNLFKPIVSLVCCMHWFNPLVWNLKEEYNLWSEASCDYNTTKKGNFSINGYFDCLIKSVNSLANSIEKFISMSSDKNTLYKRAEIIVNYSRKQIEKSVLNKLIIIPLLVGGIIIYAGSVISDNAFNFVFAKSSEQFEEVSIQSDDGYLEYVDKSDGDFDNEKYADGFHEVLNFNNEINDCLLYTIPNEEVKYIVMKINAVEKGERLIVAVTINDDENVYTGIIEPDGSSRYVEMCGSENHQFKISEPGDYKVYIVNKNAKPIDVIVSVMLLEDE